MCCLALKKRFLCLLCERWLGHSYIDSHFIRAEPLSHFLKFSITKIYEVIKIIKILLLAVHALLSINIRFSKLEAEYQSSMYIRNNIWPSYCLVSMRD
jgi:hypothetical protein